MTTSPRFDLSALDRYPNLTRERLRMAYREMCMARSHVERVVQECAKGTIKFAIWGSGEEVHGAAEALAFDEVVNPDAFGICAHGNTSDMHGSTRRSMTSLLAWLACIRLAKWLP